MRPKKAHFLQPCVRNPEISWGIKNDSTNRVLASAVLTAFDRESRNRGLLGRDALPAGAALVLAPCSGVHTWFMRFSIDLIFVDRRGTVLRVRQDVRPWRLALRPGAFAVIELPAGSARDTLAGHVLAVTPIDARSSA